jgi:hypothetical protein
MHYTYAVGFLSSGCSLRMVCEKLKHFGAYIVFIQSLIFLNSFNSVTIHCFSILCELVH